MSIEETAKSKIVMSPEQKKAFIPVMIGIIIYSLIATANTSVSSAFVLYASKFEVPVSRVVIANSCMTGVAFVLMQFTGKFAEKFGAKKCMLVSYIGITAGLIIMGLATNVQMVWVGFSLMGANMAFGQTMSISALIRGWTVPKVQERILGLVLGTFTGGGAIWPLLGGLFFTRFDLSTGFLLLIPCYLIPGVIAYLLVKNKAEDAGVKPIGWTEEETMEEKPAPARSSKVSANFMFKTIPFWIAGAAMILIVVLSSQMTLFVTVLQMAGMTTTTATALSSVAALIGLPSTIIGGWIKDKFGIRPLTVFAYGMVIICALFLYLFLTGGSVASVWLFVVTNALSRVYLTYYSHACSYIYRENASLVQPRLQSFNTIASVFVTPIVTALAEKWGGWTNMTWVWMICAVVVIILWFVALKSGDKMNSRKA